MTSSLRQELYESLVGLRSRPASVPTLLLTSWRVPVVALLVAACRQQRAKREQLIVLNWAIRDPKTFIALEGWLANQESKDGVLVRYEPALVRATNIAHGLGLLTDKDGWLELTPAASGLISEIEESDAYADERRLLDQLPKKVSLTAARALLAGGRR